MLWQKLPLHCGISQLPHILLGDSIFSIALSPVLDNIKPRPRMAHDLKFSTYTCTEYGLLHPQWLDLHTSSGLGSDGVSFFLFFSRRYRAAWCNGVTSSSPRLFTSVHQAEMSNLFRILRFIKKKKKSTILRFIKNVFLSMYAMNELIHNTELPIHYTYSLATTVSINKHMQTLKICSV